MSEDNQYRPLTFREAQGIVFKAYKELNRISNELDKRQFDYIMSSATTPPQFGDLTRRIPESLSHRPRRWEGIA